MPQFSRLLGGMIETDAETIFGRHRRAEQAIRHSLRHRKSTVRYRESGATFTQANCNRKPRRLRPLVQGILDQIVGNAVEQCGWYCRIRQAAIRLEQHALRFETLAQGIPPGLGTEHRPTSPTWPTQLFHCLLKALHDDRQLTLHQWLNLRRSLPLQRLHQVAEVVERLQQILDVVRQPRAGLVNCPQVTHLLQFALAQFGHVVFGHQLDKQPEMPDQCRAEAIAGVQMQAHGKNGKLLREGSGSTEAALVRTGRPLAADHPGQFQHLLQHAVEKSPRVTLGLGHFRQPMQPLLERQADRQKITREKDPHPTEARTRIPCPAQQQQHRRHHRHGTQQGLDIAGTANDHEGQTAQHEHRD